MARRFQFPFFAVGKNFYQLRLLSRKDSELDEVFFFFFLGDDAQNNNSVKHGKIIRIHH